MKEQFAIFGNPVSHSMSPLMHNMAFESLGVSACYGRYLLKDGKELRERFLSLDLSGINITVPHKEYAYKACDWLDPFAKRVGSVNTIVYRDGLLKGYNTDAPGFLKAISEFEEIRKVLFIGAGGTAQSTSSILRDEGYVVTILNRSKPRLEKYIADGFECYTFDDFPMDRYDLIVNMTSAGLVDDLLPAPIEILTELISNSKACVDVIYGKETPFLSLAKSLSIDTKDGSDMLLYQGIIAFEYFTDNNYTFEEILPHMRRVFDFN